MSPKFGDLKRYCEKDGWVMIRDTDNWYYEKVLSNGDILRTRGSYFVNMEIPSKLSSKILKQQLRILEEEFWKMI